MAGFWDLKTLADGTYQIRTGALEGSGMLYSSWVSLPVPINWNAIEVSYAAVEELGYIKLILNGTYSSDGSVTKLNNPSSTVDSVRMGMLEMSPTNATGVISFDDFESRRFSEIGLMPEKGMDDTEALQEPGWAEKVYTYSNTHKHAVTSVTSETSQNTYEYDANGNMITRVENGITWTSTYNAENRLATMTDGTTTWLFSYDGDGNRVSHLISDGVTPLTGAGTQGTFYFMGGGFEVSSDGINQTVRKYYSIAGTTYAMSDNGTMNYLITDHLSSVVAVTDASGLLMEETRYMPFGGVRSDVGTITGTDKSFTGQKVLPDTGLLDYNARLYSPELGRFTQPDTIIPGAGNSQAWNRYSYTLNNPVKYTDPSGHMALRDGSMSCDTYLCKTKKAQILLNIEKAKLRRTSTPTPTYTPTNLLTSTPTPTATNTPRNPVYLHAGPSSTPTTIPTNTPTPIPTWTSEEQADRLTALSRLVDVAEALQMIRIPYFSIYIDIWAQSVIDTGKGYSNEYLMIRQVIAAVEGQIIAGVALSASGLAGVVGSGTGPADVALIGASYVMMSTLMDKGADQLNEIYVYPFFEEIINVY